MMEIRYCSLNVLPREVDTLNHVLPRSQECRTIETQRPTKLPTLTQATSLQQVGAKRSRMSGSACLSCSSIQLPADVVTWFSLVGAVSRSVRRGSMAVWLAQQVGPTGRVVATDIELGYLNRLSLPNLEVFGHNILEDPLDALGPGSFDLVCSRFVLFWLTGNQETAIQRMVECLRPGGWLVDEDGDWGTVAPVDSAHPLYAGYHNAWQGGKWWASRGYDPEFGRKLPALFEHCGLRNIHHEASAEVVRGGTAWARWWKESLQGIRASELADGSLTAGREQEYQALTTPLDDPSFWLLSVLLHGCRGQRLA